MTASCACEIDLRGRCLIKNSRSFFVIVGVARNPSTGNRFLGYEVILIMMDVSICQKMGGTLWL